MKRLALLLLLLAGTAQAQQFIFESGKGEVELNETQGGLVNHWPLITENTQSATVASDLGVDHLHMTATGTPPVFTAADGVTLNGTTDYVKAVADFRSGDSLGTVTAWIKHTSGTAGAVWAAADEATTSRFMIFFVSSSDGLSLQQQDGAGLDTISTDTTPITNATWHHVAISSNGSRWLIYVDGFVVAHSVNTGADSGDWFADTSAVDNFTIGVRVRTTPSTFFNGSIQEPHVYDRELSAAEITYLFNKGRPGNKLEINTLWQDVLLHLPLKSDYRQATLPSDLSVSHTHATVINGTPTFSSAGMALTPDEGIEIPATGIFNRVAFSIGVKFNPSFATAADDTYTIFDTAAPEVQIIKLPNASSNVLRIQLAGTVIEDIPEASYTDAWNVGSINVLVLTADDTGNLVNCWLNNVQILTNDSTAWANADTATLYIGTDLAGANGFDGTESNFRAWGKLLSTVEREDFQNGVFK